MRQTRTIVFEIFSSFEKNQLPVNNSASGFFTLDASVFLLSFLYSKIIIIIKKNIYKYNYSAYMTSEKEEGGQSVKPPALWDFFTFIFLLYACYFITKASHRHTHTHTRTSPDGRVDYNLQISSRPVRRNTSK